MTYSGNSLCHLASTHQILRLKLVTTSSETVLTPDILGTVSSKVSPNTSH